MFRLACQNFGTISLIDEKNIYRNNQKFSGENQVTLQFCNRLCHFQHPPHQRRVGGLLELVFN